MSALIRQLGFAIVITSMVGCGSEQGSDAPDVETLGRVEQANHSWGGYHWARTANPFTLKVGANVTPIWDTYLNTTVADWTQSSVLDLAKVAGQAKGRCRGTLGRVEVCNDTYGNNGWLGVASISITNGTHITQGTVKLNDTYFNTAKYNSPAWRNLVSCQEVGHTLGLDHQDETFDNPNLYTCMDYTNDPTTNQHPNAHDYEELEIIYAHVDSTTTALAGTTASAPDSEHWGVLVRSSSDGRQSVYRRDDGGGNGRITFVFWAS